MKTVAVLFAAADSIYKKIPCCDVFDQERDAHTFGGGLPVIAHPPCRSWSRCRGLAKPAPGESDLAFFALQQVRRWGGVLEHPDASAFWPAARLPAPGLFDEQGGWTLKVSQFNWGHLAEKKTLLYICGCSPDMIPMIPPRPLYEPTHSVTSSFRFHRDGRRLRQGDRGWRPELKRAARAATPPAFALFLIDLARRCDRTLYRAVDGQRPAESRAAIPVRACST